MILPSERDIKGNRRDLINEISPIFTLGTPSLRYDVLHTASVFMTGITALIALKNELFHSIDFVCVCFPTVIFLKEKNENS